MASHQQRSKTDTEFRDHTSTPLWLYAANDSEFNFSLDLAATELSAKHKNFFTKEINALEQDWLKSAGKVKAGWLNPPYSNILPWIEKAEQEQRRGFTTCFLVFMDSSCEWWPSNKSCIIREITGYYFDYTYKSGKKEGQTVKEWASGRIEFVNAATGELMKDPLNKPCCIIIFPGFYSGPALRESVSKLELIERGNAHLSILKN